MKKFILGLLTMVALVVVANVALAQSTELAPYEGATHSYTVSGLDAGDSVRFFITADTGTSPDDSLSNIVTWGSNPGADVTDGGGGIGDVSIDITWDGAGLNVANNYYLWIQVVDKDGDGCSNYRYVVIDPAENTLDWVLTAAGVADSTKSNSLDVDTDNADSTTFCLSLDDIMGQSFEADNGTENDGATWVYFTVNRNNETPDDYTLTFNVTEAIAGGFQQSSDGSTWSAYTEGADVALLSGVDTYYFRARVAVSNSSQQVTGVITGSEDNTGLSDSNSDNSTTYVIINPVPAIPANVFGLN